MKEDLYKRWGIPRGNKWRDYRVRTLRDDEAEGQLITLSQEDFTDGETTEEEF